MSEGGTVIVNMDEFDRFDLLNDRRIIKISTNNQIADIFASDIALEEEGISFIACIKETGVCAKVKLNSIYAKHNVICALYAFAAAYCQGVPIDLIVKGLSNYRTSGIRQNIVRTPDQVILYLDCYNAVAKSMKSAIEACDTIPVSGKRVAVLGDIAEVGDLSESMHRDVITYVNESKFDVLFTLGDSLLKAAKTATIRGSLRVWSCKNREELSERLKTITSTGDLVLFKASNASNLKECVISVWPEIEPSLNKAKKHKTFRFID